MRSADRKHAARPPWDVRAEVAAGGESRWGAAVAVLAVAILGLTLPDQLIVGPVWVLPALEPGLLAAVLVANPRRLTGQARDVRGLSLVLIAVIAAANTDALAQLVRLLLAGTVSDGRPLIYAAVGVWLTNVVFFGLLFWELDGGGPHARSVGRPGRRELLFPQMTLDHPDARSWAPSFVDYFYTSFTNQTAFSPTDTMPLSGRIKLLMLLQAMLSITTLGLVIARAVNILG